MPYCDPDGLGAAEHRDRWERKRHDPRLAAYLALVEPDAAREADDAMTTVPRADRRRRPRQIAERLDRTLFVEAGAGSGKTTLAGRPGRGDRPGPRLGRCRCGTSPPSPSPRRPAPSCATGCGPSSRTGSPPPTSAPQRAQRAAEALDDLDAAAIGTLHSFAQRILTEHPIEAALPPLIEVLDEVASGVAFDDRWIALRAELLDDADLAPALLLAMAGRHEARRPALHRRARSPTTGTCSSRGSSPRRSTSCPRWT